MTAVATAPTTASTAIDTRVACCICGSLEHAIEIHLKKEHPEVSLSDYTERFPGKPIYSALIQEKMAQKKKSEERIAEKTGAVTTAAAPAATVVAMKQALHELFGMAATPEALSASGRPIMLTVLGSSPHDGMIPERDAEYVYNMDVLKTLLMAFEMKIPAYLWGHAGVGKTTIFEQIAHHTRRPSLRVQHTANMEESHVIGGWQLRDGKTFFDLGPLPLAMKNGWLYIADEYDFGRPEVLSLYQPVLEGKPLIIKEADEENRVIKPHPNFRMVATGNTNGQGDESGLYQGTNMQNAANYERFGVVVHMPYMPQAQEVEMLHKKAGIPTADAARLVDFATRVRTEFDGAKMGNPISPRSLLYAAQLGVGKMDYEVGLRLAFINRLTKVDRETAGQLAQRVFGSPKGAPAKAR